MKTKTVQVRWLIRRDMRQVLAVEQNCFPDPWIEEDFLCVLRQRNTIGMVADVGGDVAGYMIYELHKDELRIVNLAVDPAYREQKIGMAMVNRLKDKLQQQRRKRIVCEVRETNLGAQKFFRRQGFVAYAVLREFFEDLGEDAYSFRYSLNAADDIYPASGSSLNRVFGEDW